MLTAAFSFALVSTLQAPSKLENPFDLKKNEMLAGNPLAVYIEMVRLEKAYDADLAMRGTYWQARGTYAAYMGDTVEADKDWNLVINDLPSPNVFKSSPLEGYRPEDAVAAIARAARKHRWVMVGEEHLKPQTRTILPDLLRTLRKQGFRTLAVETLRAGEPLAATQRTGTVTYSTGGYTADPVFAAGIREAVRLGYRLVPYEAEEPPKETSPGDPYFAMNFRETVQAQHLKERIFDKDPTAKVLVWAGRAHVSEVPETIEEGRLWTPMACVFKRLTGEDPLSIYTGTYAEQAERRFERPLYRWATDHGLVKRPTVFVRSDGKAYGDVFDMQIFWPRTTWIESRPDWLLRELGRRLSPIPTTLVRDTGLQLAQAFHEGEPATAVPIDQVIIRPDAPVPSFMLPKKGRFWIRVLDKDGKENGRLGGTLGRASCGE